ncbi:uncharacterized protein LOC134739573 [Pongo pygmaeus]|uniref:uncharacterized protein LOC134739573 n=1 Tax=Pongo pygmaeus TaxID=9600 RepID=UPI00300C8F7C
MGQLGCGAGVLCGVRCEPGAEAVVGSEKEEVALVSQGSPFTLGLHGLRPLPSGARTAGVQSKLPLDGRGRAAGRQLGAAILGNTRSGAGLGRARVGKGLGFWTSLRVRDISITGFGAGRAPSAAAGTFRRLCGPGAGPSGRRRLCVEYVKTEPANISKTASQDVGCWEKRSSGDRAESRSQSDHPPLAPSACDPPFPACSRPAGASDARGDSVHGRSEGKVGALVSFQRFQERGRLALGLGGAGPRLLPAPDARILLQPSVPFLVPVEGKVLSLPRGGRKSGEEEARRAPRRASGPRTRGARRGAGSGRGGMSQAVAGPERSGVDRGRTDSGRAPGSSSAV